MKPPTNQPTTHTRALARRFVLRSSLSLSRWLAPPSGCTVLPVWLVCVRLCVERRQGEGKSSDRISSLDLASSFYSLTPVRACLTFPSCNFRAAVPPVVRVSNSGAVQTFVKLFFLLCLWIYCHVSKDLCTFFLHLKLSCIYDSFPSSLFSTIFVILYINYFVFLQIGAETCSSRQFVKSRRDSRYRLLLRRGAILCGVCLRAILPVPVCPVVGKKGSLQEKEGGFRSISGSVCPVTVPFVEFICLEPGRNTTKTTRILYAF